MSVPDQGASARQRAVIADLGRQVANDADLDRVFDEAVRGVAEGLHVEHCEIFERASDGDGETLRSRRDSEGERSDLSDALPSGGTPEARALDAGEPVIVDHVRDSTFAGAAVEGVVSAVAAPVGDRDDPWGVVSAYATGEREFSEHDAEFVEIVADTVASAVRTERARRQCAEAEAVRDALADAAPAGIVELDESGAATFVSDRATEILGREREEIGDLSWSDPQWDAVDADGDPLTGDGPIDRVRETGEAVSDVELGVSRPDGERVWLSVNATPKRGRGVSSGAVLAIEDVTERRERRHRLEESERRYRTLVEQFPNGVVALVDEDLRYQTVGGDPEMVAGRSAGTLEGTPVASAAPDPLADELVPRYERALDGESSSFEASYEGSYYRFQVVPIRDADGEVSGALGMSQDITERRESERRYRTLVEHFPNGAVGLFDEDLRYTVVGGEGFEEVDATADAVVGLTLWERYPDEVAEMLEPKFRAALDGESSEFEWEFHGRHWQSYVVPVTDESGDVFAGMIMVQDVTERKEREAALREREARLERYKRYTDDVLDAIDDVFYILDEDGGLLRWNRSLAEVTGYGDDEIAEMRARDFVADGDGDAVDAAISEGFETGSAEVELALVGKDGEPTPFEFAGTRLEDPDGNDVLAGIGRDVSDRKARERALEESERRYRTLAENFPNGGVGVYDEDLRYTLVTGTMWDDLAYDAEDLEGELVGDALPPETADDVAPIFRDALDGETGTVVSQLDGRTYRVWATPLRDADGEITAGQSFALDITEQIERERKLEESNERLEQFAYAVSHDLQEPLRMVSSYLQLIERRYAAELDEDGREFIDYAVDGAQRMREMIDGLLKYSRVDTRGDPFEPVDLDEILADVREDLQVKIRESDAEIDAEGLPTVRGDGGQLRQVFQNLLDNAVEYSGDEPPEIHVGAERDGDEWEVSVSDEGIGMDPEESDRAFEVFQRLHAPDEREGTGIGLALVDRIVERHGGDVRVDSRPGDGTTFYFTLPAVGGNDE